MALGDGIGAAVMGNVENSAWQQGKVNLGEYPKLPQQLGWAAWAPRPGDSANSLNQIIGKHRARFIRKHRAGSALAPAQRTAVRTQLVISISLPRARHVWICLAGSGRGLFPGFGVAREPRGRHRAGAGQRCPRAPGAESQQGRGKSGGDSGGVKRRAGERFLRVERRPGCRFLCFST